MTEQHVPPTAIDVLQGLEAEAARIEDELTARRNDLAELRPLGDEVTHAAAAYATARAKATTKLAEAQACIDRCKAPILEQVKDADAITGRVEAFWTETFAEPHEPPPVAEVPAAPTEGDSDDDILQRTTAIRTATGQASAHLRGVLGEVERLEARTLALTAGTSKLSVLQQGDDQRRAWAQLLLLDKQRVTLFGAYESSEAYGAALDSALRTVIDTRTASRTGAGVARLAQQRREKVDRERQEARKDPLKAILGQLDTGLPAPALPAPS